MLLEFVNKNSEVSELFCCEKVDELAASIYLLYSLAKEKKLSLYHQ